MSSNWIERFDLGEGQWADISTERLHKTVTRVQNAFLRTVRAIDAGAENVPDTDAEIILAMVGAWHVVHNGAALELTAEGIGNAPEDLISALFDRCMAVHKGGTEAPPDRLPPTSSEPLPSSPPESPSTSPIPSSS